MKQKPVFAILLISLLSNLSIAGEVYVCEKNGRKEFSQLPCGENAVVLQMEGEPDSVKISIPMTPQEVSTVCKLAIQVNERIEDRRKENEKINAQINNMNAQNYRYRNYNRRYNYSYNNDYYHSQRKLENPQTYFLSKIENLNLIAKRSPETYRILKDLVDSVHYRRSEESHIDDAERTSILVSCEESLNSRMDSMRDRGMKKSLKD